MASFREQMIGVGDAVYKAVLGPAGLDLTPCQLTITTRTWPGRRGDTSKGTPVDSPVTVLGQYFPIRALRAKEIADSGGRYRDGDVIVEDISPPGTDAAGNAIGFTIAQLRPETASDNVEIIYTLSGTAGGLSGNYDLAEGRFDDWQYYQLVLRRRRDTP